MNPAAPPSTVRQPQAAASAPDVKNLLVFNLAMDPADPPLAFTAGWVAALARRVGSVDVVTMRAGKLSLPDNVKVHSLGKERGFSEPHRAFRFYWILHRLLSEKRIDACFSHMNPLFTVMGFPLLRAHGVPIVTWFAHPALTPILRLAHRASDRMVTSFPGCYPHTAEKLVEIGQGIDTAHFRPPAARPSGVPVVLCVGRLSPVKDLGTLLKAAGALKRRGVDFHLVFVGDAATARDKHYEVSLKRLAHQQALSGSVEFRPAVRREQLAEQYGEGTALVNLTPPGSGDKVVLESMACGLPTLVANTGFQGLLGYDADRLLFKFGDESDLADKLSHVLSLRPEERRAMGDALRREVVSQHSLSAVSGRLMRVLQDVVESRRARKTGAAPAAGGRP